MKAIIRPILKRLPSFDPSAISWLAVVALLLLLTSCTTSLPVSYAVSGTVKAFAGAAEPVRAEAENYDAELGYGIRTQMECWRCKGVSWIWYNTDYHKDYTCPYCSAINTL